MAEIGRAAALIALLADPTRADLACAEPGARLCACGVAASLGVSEPAVSHQLRLLRTSGLAARTRPGRIAYCGPAGEHVRHLPGGALPDAGGDHRGDVEVPA